MHVIARHMEGWFTPNDVRRAAATLLSGSAPQQARAGQALPADILTARALGSVGLGGLVALPILLTASPLLNAPLAGPAAIALGYLAAAHALALRHTRRAAGWSLAVHCGFVAWTLAYCLPGGLAGSGGMPALLLAPFFAAAPAVVRRLLAPRSDPMRAAAEEEAACVDKFAPAEAVFFLDRRGALLAATQAGAESLDLDPHAAGLDITRSVHLTDRPFLLDAVAHCQIGAPVEIGLGLGPGPGEARVIACLSVGRQGTVTMRLRPIAPIATASGTAKPAREGVGETASHLPATRQIRPVSVCDVREAMDFAVRHLAATARARGVTLIREEMPAVEAACDRRVCRRVGDLLLGGAIAAGRHGAEIRVAVRPLRGSVLIRVTCAGRDIGATAAARLREALESTGIRELVEAAGGTILVGSTVAGVSASVRLVSAGAGLAESRPSEAGAAD